jgi:hypothetical protein
MAWEAAQHQFELGEYRACQHTLSSIVAGGLNVATADREVQIERLALRANCALCDYHAANSSNGATPDLIATLRHIFDSLEGVFGLFLGLLVLS